MRFLIAAFLIAIFASPARAQAVANATIHGDVTDSSGAAVPNSQIKATQTATAQITHTTSGADGAYVLLNLPVGPYRLEVSAPSFSTSMIVIVTPKIGSAHHHLE